MTRNVLLDIIKLALAIIIVIIHGGILFEYGKIGNSLVAIGFLKFVIPAFLVINGFFLVAIFEKNHIKIWIKRVALLYGIWMLIYISFWMDFTNLNPTKALLNIVFGFNHLWYLAALLPAGILLYLLKSYSNTFLLSIAFVLFILGFCIQSLGKSQLFLNSPTIEKVLNTTRFYRNFLFMGFPFLTIGYLINKTNFQYKIKTKKVLFLFITACILLLIENILNSYLFPNIAALDFYISYLILAPAILIISFKWNLKSNVSGKTISLYSIAIYLIHPIIIFIFYKFFSLTPIPLTIITLLLSFIIGYFLIQLNRTLKYLL